MPEYIDREVVLKKIFPLGVLTDLRYTINAQAVKYAIESVKNADVVQVVRCKDCGHYNGKYCVTLPGYPIVMREPNDFCSRGVKNG